MAKKEYSLIKNTQTHLIKKVPFFCLSKEGEFTLYKESGQPFDKERLENNKHPELYIKAKDKDTALKELCDALNMNLARSIASKGLKQVKATLCKIVEEALTPRQEKVLHALPETIEIILDGYSNDKKSLGYLSRIAVNSSLIVEHIVNVMALTIQYCFFLNLTEEKTRLLALCALLHDLGTSKIDKTILEADNRLTDEEFQIYTTHTATGHDLLSAETGFDDLVPMIALEHHERIDGSGYPAGAVNISEDSQLIGIIDCYEPLTYRDKAYRKAKKPFDSLNLIKEEVKLGKFNKKIFKDFTSCLIK